MLAAKDAIECKLAEQRDAEPGKLAKSAASVLMKCLYAARMCRFDLLRAVQGLARYMAKWTRRQDQELHQLISNIHCTKHKTMVGWVSDDFESLQIQLYSDADFAGCQDTMRSTTGVHACLNGPGTSFPPSGQSKRQGCISQSTTEAELVAASHALRASGLPLLELFETLYPEQRESPRLIHFVDNQSMIAVVRTGRNPTMRHLGRVHGVSIGFWHEQFLDYNMAISYIGTAKMTADIYTKEFVDQQK
jgi:hypothetical protein